EMISPGYPLTLKTGSTLTKQEEEQTLDACNRLETLLSVKASVEQIEKASFLLSSMRVPANTDAKAVVLSYGMLLDRISAYALKKGVEDIVTGQANGISKTFMPTCGELLAYCQTIENTLLSKAGSVRRAIENTREKALKETTAREHFRPLTLIHKQELEETLTGLGGRMKNI
ncbi:phage terminase large subunit GpA2, partial [Bartonella vinsonii subsp. berkhoffii str. Tweed]